jgi:four helix bundle protein
VDSGQWTVDSGHWSVVSGQWSVVSGQWSGVSGQRGGGWPAGFWIVPQGVWLPNAKAAVPFCGMAPSTSSRIRSYRDLLVWQRAMQLIRVTYRVSDEFPKREMYGLIAQMRRAVISIPANIAEGQERGTTKDFLRFLSIAAGSLRELQTYFDVSLLLEYATESKLRQSRELAHETGRMLNGLRDALRRKSGP